MFYFFEPSAIAALSFHLAQWIYPVSGTWRQQFDWAVIEWNRDNVYEHPALRNLPDGDLSGLVLSYQETRTNCIPLDSELYATVDWPSLRVWAGENGSEVAYYVPLAAHATAVAGSYQCASANFTLSGTATAGDYVGVAFLEHYTYQVLSSGHVDEYHSNHYRKCKRKFRGAESCLQWRHDHAVLHQRSAHRV